MVTPRLFLDVDGVLNAVCVEFPDAWPDYQRSGPHNGYPIVYSPTCVARVAALAANTDAVWLTTWEERAVPLGEAIGLPICDVIHRRDTSDPRDGWWKFEAVRAAWRRDRRPFIWVDDDIAGYQPAVDWLASLPVGSYLAVAPDTHVGLTARHLDKMDEFVARVDGCATVDASGPGKVDVSPGPSRT